MPDEKELYVGKAYVVLKDGMPKDEVTEEYIRKSLEGSQLLGEDGESVQLKPFEIPASFEFVDQLPRTKADKIDYMTLEKMAEESIKQNTGKVKVLKNN